MFGKIRRYVLPEWIEYELYAFSPGKLCRRDEVRVAGNENDNVRLALPSIRIAALVIRVRSRESPKGSASLTIADPGRE